MIYNSGCRRALSMDKTDGIISEVKVEKEIQEISVDNPYSIEEDVKDEKRENASVGSDGVKLVYNTPRLFRKSLIFKTWKLFGAKKECEPKLYRPLKEKCVVEDSIELNCHAIFTSQLVVARNYACRVSHGISDHRQGVDKIQHKSNVHEFGVGSWRLANHFSFTQHLPHISCKSREGWSLCWDFWVEKKRRCSTTGVSHGTSKLLLRAKRAQIADSLEHFD